MRDSHDLVVGQHATPTVGRIEFLEHVAVGARGDPHRLAADPGVAQHPRFSIDVVRVGFDPARHHDLAEAEGRLDHDLAPLGGVDREHHP